MELRKNIAEASAQTNAKSQPRRALPSLKIAWAVTAAEGLLWIAALAVFCKFWIMLPVKYRVYGVTGLVISGLIGILRIVLFHRRLKHLRGSASKTTPS